jgi:uncharacterized membrane protein YfcA
MAPDNLDSTAYLLFAGIGSMSGISAGLLGIGGGLIVVPGLIFTLPLLGFDSPDIPKIAAATSLALVLPTALASSEAHLRRGSIDIKLALAIAPFIIAGSFFAAKLAAYLDSRMILAAYMLYAGIFAWGLLQTSAPSKDTSEADKLPKAFQTSTRLKFVAGGALASTLGLGCGFFCVPILSRLAPLRTAIGTSALLGLPLAATGTLTYLLSEAPPGCPPGCIGPVYFPAVSAIGAAAVLTAPAGAYLAHALPVLVIKRAFAVMLIITAGDLGYKAVPEIVWPETHIAAAALRLAAPVCTLRRPPPLLKAAGAK